MSANGISQATPLPDCSHYGLPIKRTHLMGLSPDQVHSGIPISSTLSMGTRGKKCLSASIYPSVTGKRSRFELNNGNHYMQPDWRMAKGIQWALRNNPIVRP